MKSGAALWHSEERGERCWGGMGVGGSPRAPGTSCWSGTRDRVGVGVVGGGESLQTVLTGTVAEHSARSPACRQATRHARPGDGASQRGPQGRSELPAHPAYPAAWALLAGAPAAAPAMAAAARAAVAGWPPPPACRCC